MALFGMKGPIRYIWDYSVLLLTSKNIFPPKTKLIGEGPYDYFGDNELENYIELLSSSGIPFKVVHHDKLRLTDIINKQKVGCVSLVITVNGSHLSDDVVKILKSLSRDYGVSLIASYNHVDHKLAEAFGISKIMGKKWHVPINIRITDKIEWAPEISGEIRCGLGWKLKRKPEGFRRNLKKFLSQVRSYMRVKPLAGAKILAVTQDEYPAIIEYRYGNAKNYYIALSSDWYLAQFNKMHQLVRGMITENSGHGMCFFDLSRNMVLRLDDPGSCYNAYHTELRNLEIDDWRAIIEILKKHNAVLNVSYVPGWIDDGNPERGEIHVNGRKVLRRQGGRLYNSKDVVYVLNNKALKLDYTSQYEGLKLGQSIGCLNIESHGLTHLNVDTKTWLKSKDKYTNNDWWYEFRDFHRKKDVDSERQKYHMQESYKNCAQVLGSYPLVIIPPGHQVSKDTEILALKCGFRIVSGEYNSILKEELIIRNDKIPSLFLEWCEPDVEQIQSGYPIVGLMHDYDLIKNGVHWLEDKITEWKKAGIKRFISFKELVGYLFAEIRGHLNNDNITLGIDISKTGDQSIRHFSNHETTISIKVPHNALVSKVEVNNEESSAYTFDSGNKSLTINIPPFMEKVFTNVTVFLRV